MPPKGRMLYFLITNNAHQFHCLFKHISSQFHNEFYFFVRIIWTGTSRTTHKVQQITKVVEEKRSGSILLSIKQKPFSNSMSDEIHVKAPTERVGTMLLFE